MLDENWESKFKSCYYSDRLLDKLHLISSNSNKSIDCNKIKKAIYYAKQYHGNQIRQSGEPYYSHPLEVAYMTADYLFETDIMVTSILHDTIEDTTLTKAHIQLLFDKVIANKVEDLTRIKKEQKISSLKLVQLLLDQKKHDILLIKYFDRMHNMQTIKAKSPAKIKKITDETLEIFLILGEQLKIKPKEQNLLMQLCATA